MESKPPRPGPTPTDRERAWSADRELARRAAAGDERAREEVAGRLACVRRFLAALDERRGGRLGPDRLDDLEQDVMRILLAKLDGFEGRATLETWAFQVCKLEHWNALRRAAREEGRRAALEDAPEPIAPSDESGETRDELERVDRALEELGPPQAHVLRLKHFDDLTFDEIAGRLGVSPNTAKTWYYRGLVRLRRLLGVPDPTGGGDERERRG